MQQAVDIAIVAHVTAATPNKTSATHAAGSGACRGWIAAAQFRWSWHVVLTYKHLKRKRTVGRASCAKFAFLRESHERTGARGHLVPLVSVGGYQQPVLLPDEHASKTQV